MIIITAEEFLEDFDYGNQELGTDINYPMIERCMVEFAKIHVAAALNEALESIPCLGSSTDIATYEEVEEAVLNAYPLTNIK
jgi:hypothetical protein